MDTGASDTAAITAVTTAAKATNRWLIGNLSFLQTSGTQCSEAQGTLPEHFRVQGFPDNFLDGSARAPYNHRKSHEEADLRNSDQ